MQSNTELQEVLDFWFSEINPDNWFAGNEDVDKTIKQKFANLHTRVAAGEYWRSRANLKLCLAEIIVLDQFSRTIFRGKGQAFAYDGQALTLAQHVVTQTDYLEVFSAEELLFLYMPYMHSESKLIHQEALKLFTSLDYQESLKYEKIHKDIIDRFGRYPHRNKALGRKNTPAEKEYLENTTEDFF